MKRKLIIKDLGPIETCEVNLGKYNIIIGPQSSGKSCVLKIASYCTWVEKRIQITQNYRQFEENDFFINELMTFHKLGGYIHEDSYIEYESEFMKFTYHHRTHSFVFQWKNCRWDYITPKISYIPSERNMVAAIPNLMDISLPQDNIRSFISDWDKARKLLTNGLEILNLHIKYNYDETSRADKVILNTGERLEFTNTSSGLQSLIPASVQLDYLMKSRFTRPINISVNRSREYSRLLESIIRYASDLECNDTTNVTLSSSSFKIIGDLSHSQGENLNMELCKDIYDRFTSNSITDVFFEEPEQNLFPPTQRAFAYQLIEYFGGNHGGTLFIATHSPYMVNIFLGNQDIANDLSLFVIKQNVADTYNVKTATDDDIQAIYDYDMDVFFNLDSIGE